MNGPIFGLSFIEKSSLKQWYISWDICKRMSFCSVLALWNLFGHKYFPTVNENAILRNNNVPAIQVSPVLTGIGQINLSVKMFDIWSYVIRIWNAIKVLWILSIHYYFSRNWFLLKINIALCFAARPSLGHRLRNILKNKAQEMLRALLRWNKRLTFGRAEEGRRFMGACCWATVILIILKMVLGGIRLVSGR